MQRTLIVVDTDSAFLQRFRKRLRDELLEDTSVLVHVVPNTGQVQQTMLSNVTQEVSSQIAAAIKSRPHLAVLIDIVVMERAELDTLGFDIARRIREQWPTVPLFLITGHVRGEQEEELFSAATLEDVDGVLAKSFLDGESFSARRLRVVFERAAARTQMRSGVVTEESALKDLEAITTAFRRDSLSASARMAIQSLGERDFWSLMGGLLPKAEGIISEVEPGRSGAVVLRVNAKFVDAAGGSTRPKAWIIKIDRDLSRVEREVGRYGELLVTPVPRRAIPRLLSHAPIYRGPLAALAVELQAPAKTLLDVVVGGASVGALERLLGDLGTTLAAMYGDGTRHVVRLWSMYAPWAGAEPPIRAFLQQCANDFGQMVPRVTVERVERFVGSKGESERAIGSVEYEIEHRYLHGDLNSRNVLVDEDGLAVLIDFASARRDHVVQDLAKLERDIIFRAASADTPIVNHSWDGLRLWSAFAESYKQGDFFSPSQWATSVPREIRSCAVAVQLLRQEMHKLAPQVGRKEYMAAVLHFVLRAVTHPEFSIQKRAFAVILAERLMDAFAEGG